ncbi:MAG: deoxyguanosinetriphosphate triphosphohydrolase [Planctomycetes bacterium]|nr:deoxyguanosinetriphosphate triphosphohydrolase [Planctomycetota bacterium]
MMGEEHLAPYAMRTEFSKGRLHPEPEHAYRTLYPRDRDRIVHSTAFRRLMHKTQVLVNQASDHHRTRLTHTLEVAQISRTIARQLNLNEDLTEAIALEHDLGHPPFGHAGEAALNDCLSAEGGFEHNHHGLRIVTLLEYRYADFPGLNLSHEVLEAQAMHSPKRDAPELARFLGVGQPLLEAQIVDAADSLAYDTHDIDDALSLGLIGPDDLGQVAFWRLAVERMRRKHPRIGALQFQPAAVRSLIDWQVTDLLEETRRNLECERIRSIEQVRRCPRLLVVPGEEVRALKKELEAFLRERVYRHFRVLRMAHKGRRILEALFTEYSRHPEQLPNRYRQRLHSLPAARVVGDYLAGMTDRYAQDEYLRLFQPYSPL